MRIILHLSFILIASTTFGQDWNSKIQQYLSKEKDAYKLSENDISEWTISDQYTDSNSQLTHVYVQQVYKGIKVSNAINVLVFKGDKPVHFANRFQQNLSQKINNSNAAVSPEKSIKLAANHLAIEMAEDLKLTSSKNTETAWYYDLPEMSKKTVRTQLMYVPVNGLLVLCYEVNIAPKGSSDWWNVKINAQTGEFVGKTNWTKHCDFGQGAARKASETSTETNLKNQGKSAAAGGYNVFPFPIEAPSFGPRQLISTAGDALASPFGWHDVDGTTGADYTITHGNNVYAYDDIANQDVPGYSPDGGPSLNFDFPIDVNQNPVGNLDAAITNLFYVNNALHDVLYRNGFDEQAGNYQLNNYNNGGLENDYVLAEAQDGGGTNNANFSAPEDGYTGIMQMYVWSGNSDNPATLTVTSPAAIANDYTAVEAGFSPHIPSPIISEVILVDDGTSPTTNGCEPLQNGSFISGKIALIDRGTCTFIEKVQEAEANGAIAVIVINNQNGAPFAMGGTGFSSIPSVMISLANGNLLKGQIQAGETVNATLFPAVGNSVDYDCSFDNGIIAHEYGHGLSIRLTGGPSNSGCLDNEEQGGEGWSDWLGLMLTIEPGDQGGNGRGIGSYVSLEPTSGGGIRRYKYSTNTNINPQTYGDLANSSGVHAVGEIWCQALWEMSWALIASEGFDPDWYAGNGGNNVALKLVIEGMKLQPCGPGYVDARDAILSADDLLYGGAHTCLIWQAFAKRGLGQNADQGDPNFTGDETEDFNIPPICQGVGLLEQKADLGMNIYPNPAANEVILQPHTEIVAPYEIAIRNLQGSVVKEFRMEDKAAAIQLDIAGIAEGLYFVSLKGNNYQATSKLTILRK